jgi:hypothetical protein
MRSWRTFTCVPKSIAGCGIYSLQEDSGCHACRVIEEIIVLRRTLNPYHVEC